MVGRRCECGRAVASFGLPGGHARWCSRCPTKPPKAVNFKQKRCECGRAQASQGLPGQGVRWCARCPGKLDGAVQKPGVTAAGRAARASAAPAGGGGAKPAFLPMHMPSASMPPPPPLPSSRRSFLDLDLNALPPPDATPRREVPPAPAPVATGAPGSRSVAVQATPGTGAAAVQTTSDPVGAERGSCPTAAAAVALHAPLGAPVLPVLRRIHPSNGTPCTPVWVAGQVVRITALPGRQWTWTVVYTDGEEVTLGWAELQGMLAHGLEPSGKRARRE